MGPDALPFREDLERAVEWLVARGFSACELDFEGGFWLKPEPARALGELARAADIALSVHAPLPAFLGHVDRGMKYKRALGMLDHTAGLARLCRAALIVIHPGFLLGRSREAALAAVAEQLEELRARLEAKDRWVPIGFEVMGRVRDLGSVDDVLWLVERLGRERPGSVRPVLDFAHLHAVTDGSLLRPEDFAAVLEKVDALLPEAAPFHIHFSDVAYANRNETKHLPYGTGTLRAEPLAVALAGLGRPAVVISESPDEESHAAIRAALTSP